MGEVTPVVVIVKVAALCPDATVMDAGTVATVLLLARLTTSPLGPAGPLSVTVPVDEVPSRTTDGFSTTEATLEGLIVSVAVWEAPPVVALTTDAS